MSTFPLQDLCSNKILNRLECVSGPAPLRVGRARSLDCKPGRITTQYYYHRSTLTLHASLPSKPRLRSVCGTYLGLAESPSASDIQ